MSRSEIRIGDTIGRLTILARAGKTKNGTILYECSCSCGSNIRKNVPSTRLRSNNKHPTMSCGCLSKETASKTIKEHIHNKFSRPAVGDIFDRWTVISQFSDFESEVICACGTRRVVKNTYLKRGRTRSCGCIRAEKLSARAKTHGLSHTREWKNAYRRKWGKEHREIGHRLCAERRAYKKRAVPKWDVELTKETFVKLSKEAQELFEKTGVLHEIDHIIPLVAKKDGVQIASGLHIHNNLRVIPASDNHSKSCYSWPDMP